MTLKAIDIANKVYDLASLPDVCVKINEIVDQPNTSTQDLKHIIETDSAITAKLLRIANSPFYGHSTKIDDLNRAIMLIGTQALRDLVWAVSSVSSFTNLNNNIVDMKTYWEHALFTAVAARVLAKKCHVIGQERIFLSGLLHDIGHLALYQLMPEEMDVVFQRVTATNERLILAEKNVLGFTHAGVSYALLKRWNLPEAVCQSVAFHHQPGKSDDYRLDASIIHIADNIAKRAGYRGNTLNYPIKFDVNAWKITNLSEKIIDSVVQISEDQFKDAKTAYLSNTTIISAA